jgi:C1A family cysteine protease
MDNEDKKQIKKIDWKKKGLGWIPDYPDLRDYRLVKDIQKEGRLQRQGDTDEIENLSEAFIQIIHLLKKAVKPEARDKIDKQLSTQINKLETKILGDIYFANVRMHRLLREQSQDRLNSCISLEFSSTSELSKQISGLKNYLSILLGQGYLKLSEDLANQVKNINFFSNFDFNKLKLTLFDNLSELFKWLREEEFDQTTKFLVMLFQYCSGIQVDGVVGLETYTTLNEYLCDPKKLENLQSCIEEIKQDNPERTKLKRQPFFSRTRLISVPSLIPNTVFTIIFDELRSTATHQVSRELSDRQKTEAIEKTIFEVTFLEQIGVEENYNVFATFMQARLIERLKTKEPQYFLDDILKDYQLSTLESFRQIFYNEFFVVEPIVSFVVKLMSPLAQSRNRPLNSVVTEALEKAKKLFCRAFSTDAKKDSQSTNSTHSSDTSATNAMSGNMQMQDLAKEALQKVAQSFETGIKLLIHNKSSSYITELMNSTDEKDKEIVCTLCFYFLVKKFLNHYFIDPKEQCKVIAARQTNIFDKQELFELEKLPNWQQIDSFQQENRKSCENKLELFSTPNLQIPVSNSLIKSFESRGFLDPQSPKPYLFLPSVVDLSYWASAVEDQGSLQSCTAFAGIALIEYFANRSRGKSTDLSPLFLYKAARNLMSLNGDVGASVRETMKAMALFGVPPEQYWAYEEDKVDEEPPSFCYSYAQNFQALKYFRLDYADMPTEVLLAQIKAVLAAGFPCMFGFTVYTSAYDNSNIDEGHIPFPSVDKDRVVGGHAVVAVGYDDLHRIPRGDRTSDSYGAFLIRNSWGTDWGKDGYGWIPYDYVLQGLTRDWWSLLKSEWFDEDSFGLGARNIGGDEPPPKGKPGG